MATKKKETTPAPAPVIETANVSEIEPEIISAPENTIVPKNAKKVDKLAEPKQETIVPKAKIGDIVFVSKEADTDLEGFKLFPQYKKYTYTVEDYNPVTDVYSLRRANLLLKLNGEFILRPEEKAHDQINRIQF